MSDITLQSFRDITRNSAENSMNRIFIHGNNLKSVGLWGRFVFFLRHGSRRQDHNVAVMEKLISILKTELGDAAENIAKDELKDRLNGKTKLRAYDVKQILHKVDSQGKIVESRPEGDLDDSSKLQRNKVQNKLSVMYPLMLKNATHTPASRELISKFDLYEEEAVAIHCYTTSEPDRGYRVMNNALRQSETAEEFQNNAAFPLIHLANSGLAKLPDYEGEVYRTTMNMPAGGKLMEKYKVGSKVLEKGFTSTTLNDKPLRDSRSAFFKIHSKHGKNIAPFSHNPGENEILFKPGTEFIVNSLNLPRNGGVIISMSEV